jgi:hypothetical protein
VTLPDMTLLETVVSQALHPHRFFRSDTTHATCHRFPAIGRGPAPLCNAARLIGFRQVRSACPRSVTYVGWQQVSRARTLAGGQHNDRKHYAAPQTKTEDG